MFYGKLARYARLCGGAANGYFLVVCGLPISSGATPTFYHNESGLHCAADCGHTLVVSGLLAIGAPVEDKNIYGWTALHWSTVRGNLLVVRELLAAGADASAKNIDGNTALHFAAIYNHHLVARELLAAGADVAAVNTTGHTAIDYAANMGRNVHALLAGLAMILPT